MILITRLYISKEFSDFGPLVSGFLTVRWELIHQMGSSGFGSAAIRTMINSLANSCGWLMATWHGVGVGPRQVIDLMISSGKRRLILALEWQFGHLNCPDYGVL